jgi:hypothetical protein
MAELVDALVSNTNGSNVVSVRSRLWVLIQSENESESEHSALNSFILILFLALSVFNSVSMFD